MVLDSKDRKLLHPLHVLQSLVFAPVAMRQATWHLAPPLLNCLLLTNQIEWKFSLRVGIIDVNINNSHDLARGSLKAEPSKRQTSCQTRPLHP